MTEVSDTALRDVVLKRLDADTKPEVEWSALVLAALEGPNQLARLLDEGSREAARTAVPQAPSAKARIAFLRSITVEGFRGIGQKATLELTPGPGLTLVVGLENVKVRRPVVVEVHGDC